MKEKINKLKENKKGQAILKLFKWLVFFFCIFIFLIICAIINGSSNHLKTPTNTSSVGSSVLSKNAANTLFQKMRSKVFNYRIKIKSGGNYYQFTGKKDLNEDIGYKESTAGIRKYAITNDGIFEDNINGRLPITNLYENLKAEYFIWYELFSYLGNMEYVLMKNQSNNDTYIYNMATETVNFTITIKNKLVTNIKISSLENEEYNNYEYDYNLEFGAN